MKFHSILAHVLICCFVPGGLLRAENVVFENPSTNSYIVTVTPVARFAVPNTFTVEGGKALSLALDPRFRYDIELVDARGFTYFRKGFDVAALQRNASDHPLRLSDVFSMRGFYVSSAYAAGISVPRYVWLQEPVAVSIGVDVSRERTAFVPEFPQFQLVVNPQATSVADLIGDGYGGLQYGEAAPTDDMPRRRFFRRR